MNEIRGGAQGMLAAMQITQAVEPLSLWANDIHALDELGLALPRSIRTLRWPSNLARYGLVRSLFE